MDQQCSHEGSKRSPVAAMSQTDEELARIACSSSNAFTELYRRHVSNVYRYLLIRVGKVHDAQDLTTQTFLAALENIARYQGKGQFRAWLLSIARCKAADYFRQHRSTLPLEMAEYLHHPTAPLEEFIDHQLRLSVVASLLHKLTPERAEALALRLFGGLSVAQVADAMGKTEPAVKMLVYRAVCDLQQQINAIKKED